MSAGVCIGTGLKKEFNSTDLHCTRVIRIKVNHIRSISLDQQYQDIRFQYKLNGESFLVRGCLDKHSAENLAATCLLA